MKKVKLISAILSILLFSTMCSIVSNASIYEEMYIPSEIVETMKQNEKTYISDEDLELLALVTMAEAEGESELGKRLVIDTVLNRVDSSYYPNTISGVIWQKGQFSSMYNGRVNKCYVSDDICRLIKEELEYRRDNSVIYFRTGYYSSYGKPMYQVGNHYFSSY